MKLSIKAGSTSETVNVFIQNSSSTTGAGLTGLVYNSSGLTAYYVFRRASSASITLATLAAANSSWSSGGFKEIDSTNAPGLYRFDIPDAVLGSGNGRVVTIYLQGATNMAPCVLEIELTATDNQSATAFITGVNSLAPPTNWNLHSIDSNGRVDVIKIAGTTQTARDVGASVLLSSGTGTGQLDFTSGVVKANLAQILGTALTETAGLLAGGFKKFFNVSSPTGTVNSIPDAVAGASGGLFIAGSNAATTANITGNLTGSVSGSVGSVTAGVTITTNNDKTGYALSSAGVQAIWDALTSALSTASSIGKLLVDNINATISSRSTYAGGDTSGTTTLLSRLTSGRASNLDNLDAAISAVLSAISGVAAAVWAVGTRTLTGFGFSVTVGTNNDKTGYALTSAYDPAKTAAQAGDAMALTTGERGSVADKVLGRNIAGGSDGGRTVTSAFRVMRNKVVVSGGTLTVYAEDDTTVAYTATITTDPAAEPITSVDPS